MTMRLVSVLLCAWLCAALGLLTTARGAAFYSSSDHVVELDPSNFEREVTQSDALWLVEFYAPRCAHCQRLTPEWKRAAAALRGVAKVGAVDGERHGALAGRYGVEGFPDIKVFGADKSAPPQDYRGGRGSRDIAHAALSAVRALVKDRLLAGGKSTGSKGGAGGGGAKGGAGRSGGVSGSSSKNSDMVELTDGNFDQLVLQGGGGGGGGGGDAVDVWMVEFFAPWCGHCKSLEPEWAAAATAARERTGGRVRLGAVDATVHRGLAGRYAISGFPTIKIFRNPSEPPEDYQGGRSRGEIAAKAAELFAETPPPVEPLQEILDEDVFGKACGGGGERQLCVVAVLPHVLDSGAAGRKAYLELVRTAAAKHQDQRRRAAPAWGWLWAEAGAQPDLEAALGGVGSLGYPVMAAVNARKARAAVLRGSFGESGIGEFLAELSVPGGGSASAAAPVAGFTAPKIHRVEAWDGKDGQLPLVEEHDLGNVEL